MDAAVAIWPPPFLYLMRFNMAKYNILIKAQGSNKELFKFFQENGTKYETEDIDTLTKMYNSLLETNPKSEIIPIHALDVELNTQIESCGI